MRAGEKGKTHLPKGIGKQSRAKEWTGVRSAG